MCDRSKEEVLARELAMQYWLGNKNNIKVTGKVYAFAEDTWEDFSLTAKFILKNLDQHSNRTQDN